MPDVRLLLLRGVVTNGGETFRGISFASVGGRRGCEGLFVGRDAGRRAPYNTFGYFPGMASCINPYTPAKMVSRLGLDQ